MINLKEFKKSYISKLLNIDSYKLKNNSDLKYLKDICKITTGKLNANAGSKSGKYPFYTCSRKVYRINNYAYSGNDIAIAGNGASIGTLHLTHGYFNAYQRTYLLYGIRVNVKYLFYVLYCLLMPEISPTFKGSAIHYMTLTALKNVYVPVPPLTEQQRIVSKVHKCFLLADMIQKERNLHQKFAHDMKQSLLLEAMTGHLTQQLPSDGTADDLLQKIQQKKQPLIQAGKIRKHKKLPPISKDEIPFKIPKNWKWVRLQNICDYVQKGKSPKYCKSGFPILNQRCIQWSGIDFDNHKNISLQTFKKFTPIRHLRSGDVLWNTTGTGTLGRLSLVQKALFNNYKKIVVNGDVMIVRSNEYINSKYLISYLSSFIIQKHLKDLITGSTNQIHLNLSVVLPLMIPLPPLAEQHRIVFKLHDLFNTINA